MTSAENYPALVVHESGDWGVRSWRLKAVTVTVTSPRAFSVPYVVLGEKEGAGHNIERLMNIGGR